MCSFLQVWRNGWALASEAGDAWQTGDWLINYAGGFVRRGLSGQIVQFFSSDQASTLFWVFLVQMTSLLVVGGAAVILCFRTDREPAWLALLLSPAFLLFPGLNVVGGARNEVLILAVVALLALVVGMQLPPWWLLLPYALYPFAVFSHEIGALAASVMIYLEWTYRRTHDSPFWQRSLDLAYISFIAIAGLMSASIAPGSAQQAAEICYLWVQLGVRDGLCSGPIDFLKTTTSEAFDFVRSQYPGMWSNLGLAALSLLPFVALGVVRRFWLLVGATCVCLIPLFALGSTTGVGSTWRPGFSALRSLLPGNMIRHANGEFLKLVRSHTCSCRQCLHGWRSHRLSLQYPHRLHSLDLAITALVDS